MTLTAKLANFLVVDEVSFCCINSVVVIFNLSVEQFLGEAIPSRLCNLRLSPAANSTVVWVADTRTPIKKIARTLQSVRNDEA